MSRKSDRKKFVQLYSLSPMQRDFKFAANPHKSREEAQRLRKMGVVFCRDDAHGEGSPFEDSEEVREMFYSQGQVQDDGSVRWVCLNWKVQVNWISKRGVNRKILENKNYDSAGDTETV